MTFKTCSFKNEPSKQTNSLKLIKLPKKNIWENYRRVCLIIASTGSCLVFWQHVTLGRKLFGFFVLWNLLTSFLPPNPWYSVWVCPRVSSHVSLSLNFKVRSKCVHVPPLKLMKGCWHSSWLHPRRPIPLAGAALRNQHWSGSPISPTRAVMASVIKARTLCCAGPVSLSPLEEHTTTMG